MTFIHFYFDHFGLNISFVYMRRLFKNLHVHLQSAGKPLKMKTNSDQMMVVNKANLPIQC